MKGHDKSGNPPWSRRPDFRKGQKLLAEELNALTDLHATRLRHALLGIAGPGVVHGYNIETDADCRCKVKNGCIDVECGFAFDYCGRILHWLGGPVCIDDLAGRKPDRAGKYTLFVHYAELREPVDNNCDPESGSPWVTEGVVFSLRPGCESHCDKCPDTCEQCITENDYICGRLGSDDDSPVPPQEDLKMLCKCCGDLCAVGCSDWQYDPNGIPLACIVVREVNDDRKDCDDSYEFAPAEPSICKHRPHVYRNPLLYELLNNCHRDLPRVHDLSFRLFLQSTWENPVPWEQFAREVERGFEIVFSKPIRTSTLHRSSIYITALVGEHESHFLDELRLPVESMEFPGAADGYSKRVRITFPAIWLRRQILDPKSRFETGALIECTIRGAMLRDRCDCMLNAMPLEERSRREAAEADREKNPKEDYEQKRPERPDCEEQPCELRQPAMPGDDFVVAFCVSPKPQAPEKDNNVPMPGMQTYETN